MTPYEKPRIIDASKLNRAQRDEICALPPGEKVACGVLFGGLGYIKGRGVFIHFFADGGVYFGSGARNKTCLYARKRERILVGCICKLNSCFRVVWLKGKYSALSLKT